MCTQNYYIWYTVVEWTTNTTTVVYTSTTPATTPAQPIYDSSCRHRCDAMYVPGKPCYCNDACSTYENCCVDFYQLCRRKFLGSHYLEIIFRCYFGINSLFLNYSKHYKNLMESIDHMIKSICFIGYFHYSGSLPLKIHRPLQSVCLHRCVSTIGTRAFYTWYRGKLFFTSNCLVWSHQKKNEIDIVL